MFTCLYSLSLLIMNICNQICNHFIEHAHICIASTEGCGQINDCYADESLLYGVVYVHNRNNVPHYYGSTGTVQTQGQKRETASGG